MKYDKATIGDAISKVGIFCLSVSLTAAVAMTPSWVGACMLASLLITLAGFHLWGV